MALENYHRALELYNKGDPEIASCYGRIGNFLRVKGEYEGALTALEKDIDLHQGPDTPDTARAFANLAVIHQLKGDNESALTANSQALQVSQGVLGESHPEMALLHNNRGVMLQSEGNYEVAVEHHLKGLAIYQGENDRVSLGAAYNNIGKVLWKQGKHNKALEMLGLAQEMYTMSGLSADHPLLANTLNNVARILVDRGDPNMALTVHKKALALRESRLGGNHPQTAETVADMGRAAHALGKHEEALQYFERALKIQQQKLGFDHAKTKETESWINKCTIATSEAT